MESPHPVGAPAAYSPPKKLPISMIQNIQNIQKIQKFSGPRDLVRQNEVIFDPPFTGWDDTISGQMMHTSLSYLVLA